MITVIDSDNYAASGIETMVFPGGEPHVKLPLFEKANRTVLFLKLRTWADVGFGALVLDAVERQMLDRTDRELILFIPYFPGARQDRADGTAPLTLSVMAKLFEIGADTAWIFDPHSSQLHSHMEFDAIMPSDLGQHERVSRGSVCIIAPDAGAEERAKDYRDAFYADSEVLVCSKKRDPATGRLSNYEMPALPGRGKYIIVDDICDGGGTFNLLADAFKKDPHAEGSTLELFVSHGIFSKGLDAIDAIISRIVTTDSWCRLPPGPRLEVIPLLPHLLNLLEDR